MSTYLSRGKVGLGKIKKNFSRIKTDTGEKSRNIIETRREEMGSHLKVRGEVKRFFISDVNISLQEAKWEWGKMKEKCSRIKHENGFDKK